jgi:hypothetical protein
VEVRLRVYSEEKRVGKWWVNNVQLSKIAGSTYFWEQLSIKSHYGYANTSIQ